MWSAGSGNLSIFYLGRISVSVGMFSRKSANLLYYILNYGSSNNGTKRGKACKNMRRLYILVEGSDMPIVMTLPPTSIASWEKYKSAILAVQRITPKEVVTEFTLGVEVNAAGTKYSAVMFKAIGVIGTETKDTVKLLSTGADYDKEVIADDYNTQKPAAEVEVSA